MFLAYWKNLLWMGDTMLKKKVQFFALILGNESAFPNHMYNDWAKLPVFDSRLIIYAMGKIMLIFLVSSFSLLSGWSGRHNDQHPVKTLDVRLLNDLHLHGIKIPTLFYLKRICYDFYCRLFLAPPCLFSQFFFSLCCIIGHSAG